MGRMGLVDGIFPGKGKGNLNTKEEINNSKCLGAGLYNSGRSSLFKVQLKVLVSQGLLRL